jgi:hypothetical protein
MLKLSVALLAAASVLAGGADRRVTNHRLVSDHDPRATLVLPDSFTYLGEDRWILHAYDDDCEMHLFVEAGQAGNVRRLYWVQFEAYFPDRPELHHTYDSPKHADIGGLDFYEDAWVAEARAPAKGESDTAHFEAMLHAHALNLPKEMAYVRFAHLPEPMRRKEMMIIYAEALAPGETTAMARGPAMADALSRRARAQISLTR